MCRQGRHHVGRRRLTRSDGDRLIVRTPSQAPTPFGCEGPGDRLLHVGRSLANLNRQCESPHRVLHAYQLVAAAHIAIRVAPPWSPRSCSFLASLSTSILDAVRQTDNPPSGPQSTRL